MRRALTAALLLLAATPAVWAQSCDLRLNADIPIRYNQQNGGLFVEASIHGEPVPLIVSTGLATTTLGRATADRLKLQTRYESKYRARGPSDGDIRFLTVTVPDLKLGEHNLGERELYVTEGTSDGVIATVGRLGQNFLYDYDLEFDVKAGRLNLYAPAPCATTAPWDGDAQSVPLRNTARGQKILFDVFINGRKMRAELDSGSPRTLLTLPAARRLGLSLDDPDMLAGPDLLGSDGKLRPTKLHQFESFAIDSEEIRNPRLAIVEFIRGPGQPKPDGIEVFLGADWLRAHRVYVARAARAMHFTYIGGPVFEK
jgi:predicted aspartyl protease